LVCGLPKGVFELGDVLQGVGSHEGRRRGQVLTEHSNPRVDKSELVEGVGRDEIFEITEG
jgi:hypothetical protein